MGLRCNPSPPQETLIRQHPSANVRRQTSAQRQESSPSPTSTSRLGNILLQRFAKHPPIMSANDMVAPSGSTERTGAPPAETREEYNARYTKTIRKPTSRLNCVGGSRPPT
ncbi:hypothetical protein LY78DRAFT_660206 [Colletotrichum sublineola]|nr:hypothetical protein LY78DRAFT_660206 [Colletotrichum sublineola]